MARSTESPAVSSLRSAQSGRRVAGAICLLLLAAWAVGLWRGRDLAERKWGLGTTCDGLPSYVGIASHLQGAERAVFLTDVPAPTENQRLFCAQFDLAPVPLDRWRLPIPDAVLRNLSSTTILLHIEDSLTLREVVEEVTTAAEEQGLEWHAERRPDGLSVVRIGRRG